jgi:hypothetical protein
MTRQARRRVLLESLGLLILLVPLHFFLHRPDRTAWGTAAALLLFFLPAMLAVARVEAGAGGVAAEAFGYLVFGFGLGLLVGGLGAIGRAVLHVVTGDPLPIRLALWVAIASSWVLATGAAYGLILFLVWSLRAAVAPAGSRARPPEGAGGLLTPAADPLRERRPGPGGLASSPAAPGSGLPPAAAVCGLAGLALGMAGLIMHLEGWAHGLALLALAAVLVVAMLALRRAAARRARSSR